MGTELARSIYGEKALLGEALILIEMDGDELPSPINSDVVKKYYA